MLWIQLEALHLKNQCFFCFCNWICCGLIFKANQNFLQIQKYVNMQTEGCYLRKWDTKNSVLQNQFQFLGDAYKHTHTELGHLQQENCTGPFKTQNQNKSFLTSYYSLWSRSVDSHARQIFLMYSFNSPNLPTQFLPCASHLISTHPNHHDFFCLPWWKCFSSSKCSSSTTLPQRPVIILIP